MSEQIPRPVILTVSMVDGTETVFHCAGYEARAGALFIRAPLVRDTGPRIRSMSGATIPRGDRWSTSGHLLIPWQSIAYAVGES